MTIVSLPSAENNIKIRGESSAEPTFVAAEVKRTLSTADVLRSADHVTVCYVIDRLECNTVSNIIEPATGREHVIIWSRA